MSITITMPALSPTMEEGNLAKWLVKEGDTVSAGDVIAEIETDKATMEVEAVDEGTVAKIVVSEGSEGVKVNSVIAVLAEDGEDANSVEVSETSEQIKPAKASADEAKAPAPKADDKPADVLVPATKRESSKPPKTGSTDEGNRVFASPLARRVASQNDLNITAIEGSGPRGRVVKADVEAALESGTGKSAQSASQQSDTPAATPKGMGDKAVFALFEEGSYEKKPHDGMRKTIAERLTVSTQTVPAYFVTMDCEIDALLALRKQMNDAAPRGDDDKPAYRLSVNDFVVKAMAMALKAVPMANVSWTSTDRLYHKHADVGVAVAVDDGLFTPIVRCAEEKTMSVISAEIKDMAGRARSKKLKPDEYQGGCTAVSNLGMFGVKEFTSIINPPHASIVSIGIGEQRAVVKGGALAVATIMAATFAFDHRAIDGALGAELAASFKNYIENPMGMLV